MFRNKHLKTRYIQRSVYKDRNCLLQLFNLLTRSSVFTFGVNAGRCLVIPGGIIICFQSADYLVHARLTAEDRSREQGDSLVPRSRLDYRQELGRVVSSPPGSPMCQTSITNNCPPLSNLQKTFVSLRNSAQPFRPSSESES